MNILMFLNSLLILSILLRCCKSKYMNQRQIPFHLEDKKSIEDPLNQQLMHIEMATPNNPPLLNSLEEEIISQLEAQIINDPNGRIDIGKYSIFLMCSVDIVLKDIFVSDSVSVFPFSIISTKSITITNINIGNLDQSVYLTLSSSFSRFWLSLDAPIITMKDINFNTPLNNNSKYLAFPFQLKNFQIANVTNCQVLGYSTKLIDAVGGENLTMSNLNCKELNIVNVEDQGLLNFQLVTNIIIKDSSFTRIILSTSKMISFNIVEQVKFNNVEIKYNYIFSQKYISTSLIKANSVNKLIIKKLNASFNSIEMGFIILEAISISTFQIESSNLTNNTYPKSQKGGLMYLFRNQSNSKFTMNSTLIERNGASSEKLDDIFTNGPNKISYFNAIQIDMQIIQIIYSEFLNNLGGIFDLKGSDTIQMIECLFNLNQGYYAPGLTIDANIQSSLSIQNSNFTSNTAVSNLEGIGGIIYISYISDVDILKSLFVNNTASSLLNGGVICFQEIYSLIIQESQFIDNSASQRGGAIFGIAINTDMFLISSNFSFNSALQDGGAIFVQQVEDLRISGCFIDSNMAGQSGGFLYAEKIMSSIHLTQSQFYNNSAVNSAGGVLFISSLQTSVIITNSQVQGNSAKIGGFMGMNIFSFFILNGLYSEESPTVISDNVAMLGGALFQYQISSVIIDNQIVSQNDQASVLNEILAQNKAFLKGNAYFLSPNDVELVGAQQYQDNLGDQCELPLEVTQNNEEESEIPFYTIFEVNSNSVVRLQFKFLNSLQDVSFNNNDKRKLNAQVEGASSYYAQITIESELKIYEGMVEVPPFCNEAGDSIFDISYQLSFEPSTEITTIITFFSQIAEQRSCIVGEIFTQQGGIPLCLPCPYHTYSFSDPYQGVSCIPIPIQGVQECYKNVMQLQQGFWRESMSSADILECTNFQQSCIGGVQANNQLCSVGHIGPLCEQCDLQGTFWGESYSQGQGYHCQKCSDIEYNLPLIIISEVLLIIFCIIVCQSSYKSTLNSIIGQYLRNMEMCMLGNSIVKQNLFGVYIKILSSYLQLQQVLQILQVRPLGIFTTVTNSISLPVTTTFLSFDCLFKELSPHSVLYFKMIFVSIFPVTVILLILLIIYSLYTFKLISLQQRKHYLCSSTLYCIVSLIQFNVILILLQLSACREIGSDSFAFLDLNLSCDDSTLTQFRIFLIFPLLFIWTLVIPLGLFYFLYSNRDKLQTSIQLQFQTRFLYGEYKQSFFFWELIRLYLRIFVAFIFTQFFTQARISGLIILFILIVYETAIIYYFPFKSKDLNNLEGESIFFAMLNIFLAMIYYNLLQNQINPNEVSNYEYTNFWQQPTFVMGLIIAAIQFLNFYIILKYIYISFYTLFEHNSKVKKIEYKIKRVFPRLAKIICKERTNCIQVSMRWNSVKKLIISKKVFKFKNLLDKELKKSTQYTEESLLVQKGVKDLKKQEEEDEQMVTLHLADYTQSQLSN